jgi:Phage integrase family
VAGCDLVAVELVLGRGVDDEDLGGVACAGQGGVGPVAGEVVGVPDDAGPIDGPALDRVRGEGVGVLEVLGDVRSVPVSDQAVVVLEALSRRKHFTGPDDLVLCDEVGHHLDDNTVRDEFYAALERAGLGHLRYVEPPNHANPKGVMRHDPIGFHDLRHTFGTQCAARVSICGRSRRGWATLISRRRCATCTTSQRTTTPRG